MVIVYALLALAGALLPWYFNVQMLGPDGSFSLTAFIEGSFANPASSSISVDVLIASTTFLIWAVTEARKLGMKHWWCYIALTYLVAFAFAFPLFLLMRERHLRTARS